MPLEVRALTEDEAPLWDKMLEVSPQRSLFAQRWWMDIVTQGTVRLLGCFQGNRLIAGMPIWPEKYLGVPCLRQPPLTPYWGPILLPQQGKYATQVSNEIATLRALAEKITTWPAVFLSCHPTLTNWLAFYWNDFVQTTSYTYHIVHKPESTATHHAVYAHVFPQTIQQKLHLQEHVDLLTIANMPQLSGVTLDTYAYEDIRRCWPLLVEAAQAHQCLTGVAVVDAKDLTLTTSAIVWDERCAYHLLSGNHSREQEPEVLRQRHALELKIVRELAPAYEPERSILEPENILLSALDGELLPYHLITRTKSWRIHVANTLQKARQLHRLRQRLPR